MAARPRHEKPAEPAPDRTRATAVLVVAVLGGAAIGGAGLAVGLVEEASALVAMGAVGAAMALHALALLAVGRRRAFWASIAGVGLHLAAAGVAVAAWMDRPDPAAERTLVLGVLAGCLVAAALVVRVAVGRVDEVRGDASRWQYVRRAPSPGLPAVLVDGIGAVVAAASAAALSTTDLGPLGPAVAAVGVAIVLLVAQEGQQAGGGARRRDEEAIRAALEVEPDVVDVRELTTAHLGPDHLLVGARLEVAHDLTVAEVAATLERAWRTIATGVPTARTIYLMPEVRDEHRAGGFVEDHTGHIDPDDPAYADVTGQVPVIDDDDIWTS